MATIAENLQTIIDIKQDIKTAIENKGVTVGDSSFTDYPTLINNIPQENTGGGGGTTPAKIDVKEYGIKLGHSTFTEIPSFYDFSNVTDMSYMFANCNKLITIPYFSSTKITTMEHMFENCSSLQIIPMLETSKVNSMDYLFYNCASLQSIPPINTSNVTKMTNFFSTCFNLQSIPLLDCGNVTLMGNFFGYFTIPTLTDLGGFKNLKISITSGFLERTPNLTVESLMNVINNVYDLTANGLSGQSLKFGSTNLNKLTEEQIAVATAKGWTLTA